MSSFFRRFKRQFGISAPRVAIRTHLSWRWRVVGLGTLLVLVAGMWWWGFDWGQFLGGFNRDELVQLQQRLVAETSELKKEVSDLKTTTIQLESELSIAKGAQTSLSRQSLELQSENSQLKEELLFLQRLLSDSGKQGALTIQRAQLERLQGNDYHLSMLIVRGGRPNADFTGRVTAQVNLVESGHPSSLILPDDQPDNAPPLTLKFRYYQRIEATFRTPPGSLVKNVQLRVFENGQTVAKATRTLNLI